LRIFVLMSFTNQIAWLHIVSIVGFRCDFKPIVFCLKEPNSTPRRYGCNNRWVIARLRPKIDRITVQSLNLYKPLCVSET
jgi:hypothetical protein